ncbi:hypothetical protein Asppvi_003816 [Aspergillus pseudoviridinutans]|uniref:Uncharacterized protein n=1 Tax=Aspergillus pseudoviridinutans TaxID=1517512 RepID=A0A9P3B560_9EURO|nr:uncharacterized protein Asppvi_003816 [Aspergillus pseudoviridinutans]GIJ84961.1 hypothetical protein Asppvi_003816 [Aspergillus pseudoviridinutans]
MDADHREGNALPVIATHKASIVFIYNTQVAALPQLKASTGVLQFHLADNAGGIKFIVEDGPVAAVRLINFLKFSVELEEECLGQPGLDELVRHYVRKFLERIKGADVVKLRGFSGNLLVQSVYAPFDAGRHSVQCVLPPSLIINSRGVEKRLEGAVNEPVTQPVTARLCCPGCFVNGIASPNTNDKVQLFTGRPDNLTLMKGGPQGTVSPDAAVLKSADSGEILGRTASTMIVAEEAKQAIIIDLTSGQSHTDARDKQGGGAEQPACGIKGLLQCLIKGIEVMAAVRHPGGQKVPRLRQDRLLQGPRLEDLLCKSPKLSIGHSCRPSKVDDLRHNYRACGKGIGLAKSLGAANALLKGHEESQGNNAANATAVKGENGHAVTQVQHAHRGNQAWDSDRSQGALHSLRVIGHNLRIGQDHNKPQPRNGSWFKTITGQRCAPCSEEVLNLRDAADVIHKERPGISAREEKAAVEQTLDLLVGPAGAVLDIVAAKQGP